MTSPRYVQIDVATDAAHVLLSWGDGSVTVIGDSTDPELYSPASLRPADLQRRLMAVRLRWLADHIDPTHGGL